MFAPPVFDGLPFPYTALHRGPTVRGGAGRYGGMWWGLSLFYALQQVSAYKLLLLFVAQSQLQATLDVCHPALFRYAHITLWQLTSERRHKSVLRQGGQSLRLRLIPPLKQLCKPLVLHLHAHTRYGVKRRSWGGACSPMNAGAGWRGMGTELQNTSGSCQDTVTLYFASITLAVKTVTCLVGTKAPVVLLVPFKPGPTP